MANRILDIDEYNRDLRKWANNTKRKMTTRLAGQSLRTQLKYLQAARARENRKPLNQSIKTRLMKEAGAVDAIRFIFPRHGVFVERGIAGKNSYQPRPWIAPAIEEQFPQLEKIILEHYEKGLKGQLRLLVPGVVDKTADFDK